jgi:Arylsulfotransferase (ASST)
LAARGLRGAVLVGFVLLTLVLSSGGSPAATETVHSFPIPGGTVASPQTQIAFRGALITPVSVRGSESGLHTGVVLRDTDGQGTSFIPDTEFTPGETVTVTSPPGMRVAGATGNRFQFRVASPGPQGRCTQHAIARQVPGEIPHFRSQPSLHPPRIRVLTRSRQAERGDMFLDPGSGPVQTGPMIVGPRGQLIWFKPLTGYQWASDFTVQRYQGRRVLTWWQGCNGRGGQDMIYDSSYRPVAVVKAGNGLWADLHEFEITRQSTALITAYYPVYRTAATPGGLARRLETDSVVQEVDIRSCQLYGTCLVLFQWDSLDHVPVRDSEYPGPSSSRGPTSAPDYFHVNSVHEDADGNLIIGSRDTWAVYKVSRQTGRIMWTLGGKRSNFSFGPGARFAFQHDARVAGPNDRFMTMFDDEGGPPAVRGQSRALKLRLDFGRMRATLVRQFVHSPPVQDYVMGSAQPLAHSHVFVGWGPSGYFSEYNAAGRLVFDARFAGPDSTYRAFRFRWTGTPAAPPAAAASHGAKRTRVYASWNGSTQVTSWRVLGGSSASTLRPLKTAPKMGFETPIVTRTVAYVAVEALGHSGRVLGRSATIRPG